MSLGIVYADEHFCKILKYRSDEIINLNLKDIFLNFDKFNFLSEFSANDKLKKNDETIFEYSFTIKIIPNPISSSQKLGFIHFSETPNKFQLPLSSQNLLDNLMIPIIYLDGNLKLRYLNHSAKYTLGINPQNFDTFDILHVLPDEEEHFIKELISKPLNKHVILTSASNNRLDILFQSSVIYNVEGQMQGVLISLFDFSELKSTEQKLRNSETRLRTIFATMNSGIVIVDLNGKILEIAPIFKFLLFQYIPLEKDDFIFSFLENEIRETFLDTLKNVAISHHAKSEEFNYKILDKEHTFEVRFLPIRHYLELENVVMLVFNDRTEAKQIDRQLIESMKFASIGELAASLAHEINNPLQSALLYLDDLILIGEEDPVERKMILKKIESANFRIRDLVRSLLDLGRVESQTRDLVSPYYILVRSSELLEVSCKKKSIHFLRHAGPNLPGIIVRWQEIEQVLINCVVNSINALSEMDPQREKPKVEIGIDLVNKDKKDWVVFSIEDNGPGMTDDILDKAFMPLFTTRREMQGTGLGLSISKKIINDHDGDIFIKSKLGVGTKIEIFLPAQVDKND